MPACRSAPLRTLSIGVIGAALASGLGWIVLSDMGGPQGTPLAPASSEGKISDRLSFVEEDFPVRQTRIFDTVAMFGMETAEGRAWSERSVPTLAALEGGTGAARTKAASLPRMVVVDRAPARSQALPPSRPLDVASATPTPVVIPVRIAAPVEPAREPVRLLGWNLPGSQHLPTRKDAVKTAEAIGDKAVKVGSGTASFVSDAASAMGETVSSVGSTVAEIVGLR